MLKGSVLPVYFDNAATTPLRAAVCERMQAVLSSSSGHFGNPGSTHFYGNLMHQEIETARADLAETLICDKSELIFTSGATEANNLAILGVARANKKFGKHIITSAIEHKSVLAPMQQLSKEGFEITYLNSSASGRINSADVKKALRPDTLLVSVMAVNNETGVMQPIQEIGELLSEAGILFHTDLAQYAGKFTTNFSDLPVDLASFSAHKFYGPKGSGLLFARNRKRLAIEPVISGGGQEFSLRAGTLATHQILGLCAALQVAQRQLDQDYLHIQSLKEHLIKGLAQIDGVIIHGDQRYCSAYIANFSVRGIDASVLLNGLADTVAFSNGAACSSGTIDPSHVLRNMGLQGNSLYGAVRVSFGYYNTLTEVELFLQGLQQLLSNLEDKLS